MNEKLARSLYNLVLPAAAATAYAAAPFHAKLREAAAGRRGWRRRWRDAGRRVAGTRGGRPAWFHVASVGEFEQARPIISALARGHPDVPVVVSFSSPSGYRFAAARETLDERNNIEFIDYLPADFARNARACIEAIDPRILVFVKFDLWPNLIWEARERGIPVVLVDATLSPSSRRAGAFARGFYSTVYSAIEKILAISDEDAGRFRAACPRHRSIHVCGDTRFDRVMERRRNARDVHFDVSAPGRKVVVCGSTWPRDESRLLDALGEVLGADPRVHAIVAPHEPLPRRVASLAAWARGAGLSVGTVRGGIGDPPPRVVLVDTVGILAETYRMGDVAYVGGGFSTGVHSVIEPAIEGLPVLFGPHHDNSFEALRLVEAGAGVVVDSTESIRGALVRLLGDEALRRTAGESARAYVESQVGATEKCMAAIREYL